MSARFLLLCVLWLAAGFVGRADEPMRHSKTLSTAAFESAGLAKLSSDELAVLDALVRRDLAQAQRASQQPRVERFSERLSEDERRNAGFARLSTEEIAAVDASVQARIAPPGAGFSIGEAGGGSSGAIHAIKVRRDPEIHGSATLMVAAGSHGYRAYGGALEVTYDDPANNFSVGVGVAQIRSKGGWYHGYCYDRSRLNRHAFGPLARGW